MNKAVLQAINGTSFSPLTLKPIFWIKDISVVANGYFFDSSGNSKLLQASTTTAANDSVIMPENDPDIILALTKSGLYSIFYTDNYTPKKVKLSDIATINCDYLFKDSFGLYLLKNNYDRANIKKIYTKTSQLRATNSLLRDPSFSETSKISDRTTGKMVWWEEYKPYGGVNGDTIEYVNDVVLINNRRYHYLKINSGAVNAIPSTYAYQKVYFYGLSTTDVISISAYVKTSTANGGVLGCTWIDRNGNAVGSRKAINVGNTSGAWTLKKVENITIPASVYGIMCLRFEIGCNNGSTSCYFTQPVVNVGSTALEFENSYDDYSEYKGLERFVAKCVAGSSVNVAIHGDSITRANDVSQTSGTGVLSSMILSEIPRLFGNSVSVRNNSADGSNHLLEFSTLKKMSLNHSSDLVFMLCGRNTANTYDELNSVYKVEETNIRRILTNNINTDIIYSLPCFRKHGNPIASGEADYYAKDLTLLSQRDNLVKNYNISKIESAKFVKTICDTSNPLITWDLMYNTDRIHPQSGGVHFYRFIEIKKLIARALRYSNNRQVVCDAINTPYSLNPITLYSSDFGTADGSVKSGTWLVDPNCTMNGGSITAGGTTLGEYSQPIVSSNQGDYLQYTWTGSHFAILFVLSSNRGIATIELDGVSYDVDTNGTTGNSSFSIATFGNDHIKHGISLVQGSHTIRIIQKNSGTNANISVSLLTVF